MLTLNPFLAYLYWTYAPIVLAQEQEQGEGATVTFVEDNTGVITNGISLSAVFLQFYRRQ
jgi:hypothetical protein